MSKALRSYPKVWSLGHPNIAALFDGPVVVQEKIDGSQFSFGVLNGEIHFRSKGATIYPETTDNLFRGAVDTVLRLFHDGLLEEGWTYRAEAMMGPKHNALQYERAPTGNFILFDVDVGLEDRLGDPARLADVAARLGLEHVPVFFVGEIRSADELADMLARPSCLGGTMEGVVVKNYARWADDGKMLMGKVVAESFREVNKSNWKKENPSRSDVIELLIGAYRTDARWQKSVQHLRESGALEGSPRDIGRLIKAVGQDTLDECADEIKDALFRAFWKDIQRGITRGLPEWYRARLAENQFPSEAAA
jgi:hypothetical protein